MVNLEVCRIGDSLGVVLPESVLAQLNVAEGDALQMTGPMNGAIQLTAQNRLHDAAVAAGRRCMAKYDNALRELAK